MTGLIKQTEFNETVSLAVSYNEYQQIGFSKSIDLTALWISEYTASKTAVLKK